MGLYSAYAAQSENWLGLGEGTEHRKRTAFAAGDGVYHLGHAMSSNRNDCSFRVGCFFIHSADESESVCEINIRLRDWGSRFEFTALLSLGNTDYADLSSVGVVLHH